MSFKIHPNIEKIAFLIGTWRGTGRGEYPTISAFEYREEITFSHVGKPFLAYTQKTSHATTGQPLHSEMGFMRVPNNGRIELVLAQPTGLASVEIGDLVASSNTIIISLSCSGVGDVARSPTAKHPWVQKYMRRIVLESENTLSLTFDMETENQPMQHHLSATLHKVLQ